MAKCMGSGTPDASFSSNTHKWFNPGARFCDTPVQQLWLPPLLPCSIFTEMLKHLRSLPAHSLREPRPSHNPHSFRDLSDVTLHMPSFASNLPGQVPFPQMLTEISLHVSIPSTFHLGPTPTILLKRVPLPCYVLVPFPQPDFF